MTKAFQENQNHINRKNTIFIIGFIIYLCQASELRLTPVDNQYWAESGHGTQYPAPLVSTLWSAPLFVFTLFYAKRQLRVLRYAPVSLIFILGFAFLSVIWSINELRTIRATLDVANALIFCGLAIHLLGLFHVLRILFYFGFSVLLVSTVLAVADSSYTVMQGSHEGLWRGLFNHKNVYAPFVATLLLLTISCRQIIDLRSDVFWSSTILCVVSLFMAGSSTAIASTVFAFSIYFIMLFLNDRKLLKFFIIFIVSAVAMSMIPFIDEISNVIVKLFGKDVTFSGRTTLWLASIPVAMERPLYGYGFGTSGGEEIVDLINVVTGRFSLRSVHNVYINMALDIGLIATAVFILWLISKALGMSRSRDARHVAFMASIAALHSLLGVFEVMGGVYGSYHWVVLLVAVNICAAYNNKELTTEVSQDNATSLPGERSFLS